MFWWFKWFWPPCCRMCRSCLHVAFSPRIFIGGLLPCLVLLTMWWSPTGDLGRNLDGRMEDVSKDPVTTPRYRKPGPLRVAVFMTTHWSKQHKKYLSCWEYATKKLKLLKNADLVLYTSERPSKEELAKLHFHKIKIKDFVNPGYQSGAVQAWKDAFGAVNGTKGKWFKGYDWVIRLNPDVLIFDDKWLLATMHNSSIDGIFQNCGNCRVHSDFLAIRPEVVNHTLVDESLDINAEQHLTFSLVHLLKVTKRWVWIEGGEPVKPQGCRITGNHSPAVHNHTLSRYCPDYFKMHGEQHPRMYGHLPWGFEECGDQ